MARRFRAGATTPREERLVSGAGVAMGALAVVVVVGLSGPGGFGVQTWDWAKHNAILKDLVEQPWPVAYATERDDVALTYYVAHYLPAALAGKLAGWQAANVVLFAWTVIGCVLAMLWLVVLSGAPVWRCLAIFVLFSGLDVVGAIAWSSRWSMRRWPNDFHLEWWAGHWTYPGNVTLIAFAPHQATAGWLLTGLTIDGLRRYPARFPLVMEALSNGFDPKELRDWLVTNVRGLGYKESAHFLRNIGYRGLAILDRHILRNLKRFGVIRRLPPVLNRKRYLHIEEKFLRFADLVGIPIDELDLLFWSMETGVIRK